MSHTPLDIRIVQRYNRPYFLRLLSEREDAAGQPLPADTRPATAPDSCP